ncbi:copper resistance protein CopC [Xylanimonas oleitrophica]|uniref:Copper resistance protein CopC n=2 Tax=Xylanimonas oleitrophica TaxID=2607479 RepID=A0A2W5WZ93_9MICO|nr:copper resistance protein CopC [Xylanimonas oleitrophica]
MAGSLAVTVAAAGPASAHNYVVGTVPAAGQATSEPVDQVSVTFNDVLLDLDGNGTGTALEVTGPDGTHHETSCPVILDRTVSASAALGEGGTYTVVWRVVSADGHPISGDFTFDYQPPEGVTPVAGTSGPACGAEGEPEAADDGTGADEPGSAGGDGAAEAGDGTSGDATPSASPATAQVDDGTVPLGAVLAIAGGTVVLAGAAVLVALRLLRRRD